MPFNFFRMPRQYHHSDFHKSPHTHTRHDTGPASLKSGTHTIKVVRRVLDANDIMAGQNRRLFQDKGVFVLNMMSSPGSGKTTTLEKTLARIMPEIKTADDKAVAVDLDQPMDDIRALLTKYPVATPLKLTGRIVVARDIAHARLKERLDKGEDLPEYIRNHIIYYAGPAKTPKGYAAGSFGPTTAARMDPYVPIFQARGGSMVMLAKGNRSKVVTDACKKYGGFYLGSIGGPAARLGKECITDMKILEYPELGMEAIYMITVKDFPAFILVDDKGNDFFDGLLD